MAQISLSNLKRTALVIASVLLVAAAPAAADSLAAIPDAGSSDDSALSSFSVFAKKWMAKMETAEARNRQNPTVAAGPNQNQVTYRGFGKDFTVELRPTGQPSAPFIGILRYSEQIYSCREVAASNCSVASSSPVTEIFRYQSGRWIY
jgi:predicted small secreted protein